MPKKNAFFYFMLEYKRRQEGKGRKFANLGQVTPFAGEIWEKMSADERKPYVERANAGTEGTKEKLTSLGLAISSVESQLRAQRIKEQVTKDLTDLRVMLTSSETELAKEVFYIISMEYFCCTHKGVYIPAELGVVKYSLEFGVMDQLHIHVKAREIPIGYAGPTMDRTNKTHQLPVPPNALGISDFNEIANSVLSFLETDENLPLLFTDAAAVPAVENMLMSIMGTRESALKTMHICPLAPLLFRLTQGTARYSERNAPNIPSALLAQEILSVDQYGYTQGISCDYHEQQSNGYYCALSRAIRWTYIISTYCCDNLGIKLIPGKHIPDSSKPLPVGEMLDAKADPVAYDGLVGSETVSGNNPRLFNRDHNSLTHGASASLNEPPNRSLHDESIQSVASKVETRLNRVRNQSIADMPKNSVLPGESPLDSTHTTISSLGQRERDPSSESVSGDETGNVCTDGSNFTLERISRRAQQMLARTNGNESGSVRSAGNTTLDRICREWKSTKPNARDPPIDSIGNNTLDRIIDIEVEKKLNEAIALGKRHTDERSSRSQRDTTLDTTGTSVASATKVLQTLKLGESGAADESNSLLRKVTQKFISSEVEKRLELVLNASKNERAMNKSLRCEYSLNSANTSITSTGHSKLQLAMQLSEGRPDERSATFCSGTNNTLDSMCPVEQALKLSESHAGESISAHSRVKTPSNRAGTSVSSLEQQPNTDTADDFLTPLENPRRMVSVASSDIYDDDEYEYQPRMYNRKLETGFPTLQEAAANGKGNDRGRGRGHGRTIGRGRGRARGRGRGRGRGLE
uniref:HMG box domain-containing protein n=1 Tax=Anopheles maculatus TaxID=74869 RepID=A0A182S6Z3_9DIPT